MPEMLAPTERADRPGPRRVGRPRHRRPLLGRHLGHGGRPRRARGVRRRHDRAGARRRLDHDRRAPAAAAAQRRRRRARARAGPPGGRRRRATPAACWPSSRRTRRARAAARCSTAIEAGGRTRRSRGRAHVWWRALLRLAAPACPCRARRGSPCAGRSFFFSMRSISRRLLRPDMSDQIHQSEREHERQAELPEVAEELPVPACRRRRRRRG